MSDHIEVQGVNYSIESSGRYVWIHIQLGLTGSYFSIRYDTIRRFSVALKTISIHTDRETIEILFTDVFAASKLGKALEQL